MGIDSGIETLLGNKRLLVLAVILLLVAGLSALSSLPRSEDPWITNRWGAVMAYLPGASAERVEALVTEPIELALRRQAQIKLLESTSRPGVSVVSIELSDQVVDVEPVWSKIRDRLADIAANLPTGTQPPALDVDQGHAFTTMVGLTWRKDRKPDRLTLGRYGKELGNQLRSLAGTEYVETFGIPEEEVLVSIDPAAATALDGSVASLAAAIAGADSRNAAGLLANDSLYYQLEVAGALDTVERVRRVPVRLEASGHKVKLDDIATVERVAASPPHELALVSGRPGVIVAARMNHELRVDLWSERVHQLLARFQNQLPDDIRLEVMFEQQVYTRDRLNQLTGNLLFGFVLILAVLLVFMGWRSALIVALSLPLTSCLTLAVMNLTGIPIHQMSVTGLIVALGILVDNAIVMVDTISQYRQRGLTGLESAHRAIRHLWVPLLGATLTTVLAFAPVFLMPGPAGEFVGAIAFTVTLSLLGSYLISHTLIAGFAAMAIHRSQEGGGWFQCGYRVIAISRLFARSIGGAIRFPLAAMILVGLLPFSGFWAAAYLTEQFFPASDRDMFEIRVYLAPQASIHATESTVNAIDKSVRDQASVERIDWLIGGNVPAFYYNLQARDQGAANFAQAMVKVADFQTANRLIPALQTRLDEQFPHAQVIVRKLEQGPPFNAPIELRLLGPDLDQLRQLGEQVRAVLANTDQITHTRETLQPGTPKIWLKADEDTASLSGMTLSSFAGMLQASLAGRVAGSVVEVSESIPVRVRVGNRDRQSPEHLNRLRLPVVTDSGATLGTGAGTGKKYPVGLSVDSLTELEIAPSRGTIPRRNGERINVIEGYIKAGVLPQGVLQRTLAKLADLELPPGYRLELGGETAERGDAVRKLMSNLVMVLSLLFTVVVLIFNSFRLSLVILLVGFQATGLGLLSVWLTGYSFGFTVIIGLLGVYGLAINSAIVILAELKADHQACLGDEHAMVNAVMRCSRHIAATTVTTVAGFIPMILSGGGFWPPFAVAITGGTLLTTVLSFYSVPAAFRLLSGRRALTPTLS